MEKLTTQKNEMSRLIDESFNLGYSKAIEELSKESFSPEVMLSNFLNFMSGYRIVFTDDGVAVADGDNIYHKDYIIKLFKLKYGYDAE